MSDNERIAATLDRLISNIPAACKVLLEEGYANLAGQLGRDCNNLVYWQERGGLVAEGDTRMRDVFKADIVVEAVTRSGEIYPAHLRAWAKENERRLGCSDANLVVWLREVANALEKYQEEDTDASSD